MARVLLVDDDDGFCSATKTLLGADGHEVTSAGSIVEAIATLKAHTFDVMLIDLSLPDGSGLQLITDDRPPAVIITGHPSVETAVRALRGPVVDYLIKPVDRAKLNDVLDSLSEADLQPETASSSVDHIIGDSEAIQSLREQILQFGPLNETVLITGESGTGKELVAKALHRARNPKGKLVAINCGAIAPELIASELFGHEKGAFTGATSNRAGVFETAGDGTVFLDEIGELP
ncbi:MAG: sigma 54-interacting transcriptional regulator, partial [Pseudomonadota bacterium]